MQENVREFDVTVHYLQLLHIVDTLHELAHDDTGFLLLQCSSLLKQYGQVKAICVFLDHVDFRRRLDRLVVLDAVVARDHAMYLYLFEHLLHLCVLETLRVDHLTSIDRLLRVYSRSDDLLSLLGHTFGQQISG